MKKKKYEILLVSPDIITADNRLFTEKALKKAIADYNKRDNGIKLYFKNNKIYGGLVIYEKEK